MSIADEKPTSFWMENTSLVIHTETHSEDPEGDEFDFLECEGSEASNSTSLLACVREHEYSYNRRYHGYKRGKYPLPNDSLEQQREETTHALLLMLTNGRLIFSDIECQPHKIIDIGTGTGSWAIDVADEYPSALVIGTDISPIQPTWLPVNARMFVEDCEEDDWLHGSDFDLVHMRSMAGLIRDLDGVISRVSPHIREDGFLEFHEFTPEILCDDATMTQSDGLAVFNEIAQGGLQKLGFTPFDAQALEDRLRRGGFTNVRSVVKKVPISGWADTRQMRTVGVLMRAVLEEVLDAMAAKPMAALGLDAKDRMELLSRARESLYDEDVHRYVKAVFVWGQKAPLVSDSESYTGLSMASWSNASSIQSLDTGK